MNSLSRIDSFSQFPAFTTENTQST